jgi:endonuclease YncB( thermonuclease family)
MMLLAMTCFVTWVIDGDTFVCRNGEHVRIAGVDAPELHGCQPGRTCTPGDGHASLHAMIRLAKGREAACAPVGRSYDRVLAFCAVDGVDLSCAMLSGGYAVRRYSFGPYVCRGLPPAAR